MQTVTKSYIVHMLRMQEELDAHILENADPTVDTRTALKIALSVEFGEFCNEGQWFKFWKRTRPGNRIEHRWNRDHTDTEQVDRMLEEYVDVLHFMWSLGISYDAERQLPEIVMVKPIGGQTDLLKMIKRGFLLFGLVDDYASWQRALEHYLAIGEQVGFTPDAIFREYCRKNVENHRRRREGY